MGGRRRPGRAGHARPLDPDPEDKVGTLVSTFGVIFIAELADKTALASLVLATRYRAASVVVGAWLAFLVQTVVAVVAGGLIAFLPERPIRIAAGAGFLVFAVLAWRRDEAAEAAGEERTVARESQRRRPAWLSSFLVVFAAEWGDLTQLATAALVAQTKAPVPVGLGALAALWLVTVLAVSAGSTLSRHVSPRILARVSACVFVVVGTLVIVSAAR
jgi:Ca2+/H+ antiporter, TMEM165/GDT1 family